MRCILIIVSIYLAGCDTKTPYPEGGFDYPGPVTGRDTLFYAYPIRDSLSGKDSFIHAYDYVFYQPFNEPNLSLRPMPQETFRLIYSTAFNDVVIFNLTKGLITVKSGHTSILFEEDTSRLSGIEQLHLTLLNRRYPIERAGKSERVRKYLDSMVRLYPQLLDPMYYHKLYDRSLIRNDKPLKYGISRIAITDKQYNALIREINASGFWQLPYKIGCKKIDTDGYGFRLEANTKTKYKVVTVSGCSDDTTRFTKACQKIIDMAGLKDSINLIWEGSVIPAEQRAAHLPYK